MFKDASGRARLQHIEVGHCNAEAAEILSGLADGDKVILHPSDTVVEGAQVAPR